MGRLKNRMNKVQEQINKLEDFAEYFFFFAAYSTKRFFFKNMKEKLSNIKDLLVLIC